MKGQSVVFLSCALVKLWFVLPTVHSSESDLKPDKQEAGLRECCRCACPTFCSFEHIIDRVVRTGR